jgi:predicted PurR-regulated permease PerM
MTPYAQNVLSDSAFWDKRARKDFAKLGTYPRALNNADANILRVQNKMSSMSKDVQNMQAYILGAITLEHFLNEGNIMLLFIPYVLFYIMMYDKRFKK